MHQHQGFSLVELSIVLVILGLLTGGILAGQSLIRASELRSLTSDLQRYSTAMNTFRDKYFAIPGDMNNATKFWTAQDPTPATCQATASTTQATCDGDGDGTIDLAYEEYRGWQHLANAGLIEGSYTGVAGAGGANHSVIGTNVPRGKLSQSGFSFVFIGDQVGGTLYFAGNYGNAVIVGAQQTTTRSNAILLRPEELWNIDTKMDDGRPAYGKIVAHAATFRANCTSSDTPSVSDYLLTSSAIGCAVIMKNIGG